MLLVTSSQQCQSTDGKKKMISRNCQFQFQKQKCWMLAPATTKETRRMAIANKTCVSGKD